MPRQLRIEYEGALYHPMNRGDRREWTCGPAPNGQLEPLEPCLQPPVRRKEKGVQKVRTDPFPV